MQDYLRADRDRRIQRDGPGGLPTATPTWRIQFANDLSILRGEHQFGVGANYIH